jgi:hypothetical protein
MAYTARVKAKEHEKLTEVNINKVISLLNPEAGKSPISKKDACNILNIAYNTTRLDKIINEHLERQEYIKGRKAALRGKPASAGEISETVSEYLQGRSVADISKSLHRSTGFVNKIIDDVGIPSRQTESGLIPEACIAEDFAVGEKVWSAQHNCIAVVKQLLDEAYVNKMKGMSKTNYEKLYSTKCYAIYVLTDMDSDDPLFPGVKSGGYFAYAPSYELGKLTHLQKYGVDLAKI